MNHMKKFAVTAVAVLTLCSTSMSALAAVTPAPAKTTPTAVCRVTGAACTVENCPVDGNHTHNTGTHHNRNATGQGGGYGRGLRNGSCHNR